MGALVEALLTVVYCKGCKIGGKEGKLFALSEFLFINIVFSDLVHDVKTVIHL